MPEADPSRPTNPLGMGPLPVVPLGGPPPLPQRAGEGFSTPEALHDELAGPRFCNRCGCALDPATWLCPGCTRAADAAAAEAADAPARPMVGRPIASALGLYFTILGTLIAGAVAIAAAGPETVTAVNIEIGIALLDALIVAVWCIRSRDNPDLLPLANVGTPLWYGVALAAVPVTFGLATATVWLLTRLTDVPVIEMVRPILGAGYGWGTVILLTCVQPAVIEELAFRGIVLGGMRQLMPDRDAIIVSALMFMIIHLSFLSFPHLVLIGLVLGWVRVKSGSLYPCMLMHFGHNLCVVLTEHWVI